MVADIKIKFNTIDATNYLKKISKNTPRAIKESLNRVSAYAVDQITEKTQKGQKPDGGTFARYSEMYKQSKQFKKKENKFVDLKFHGHMLNSLAWANRGYKNILFFRRKTEQIKAYIHDTGVGKMPTRPFFAIGKKDENKIKDIFARHYYKLTGIR